MSLIEEICTITSKGQTTVPKAVRQALGVSYGGRIAFRVRGNTVTVHALPAEEALDPALAPFLALLQADLTARPAEAIQPLTTALVDRLDGLTRDIDPDAAIEGDVAL